MTVERDPEAAPQFLIVLKPVGETCAYCLWQVIQSLEGRSPGGTHADCDCVRVFQRVDDPQPAWLALVVGAVAAARAAARAAGKEPDEHTIPYYLRRLYPELVSDAVDISPIVVPPGLSVRPHEMETAERLRALGFAVEFLPVSDEPGRRNPDILLNGEIWEMKSPQGNSEKNTIDTQLRDAGHQSAHLVLDTSRTPLADDFIVAEVRRRLQYRLRLKSVIILLKNGDVVRINRSNL